MMFRLFLFSIFLLTISSCSKKELNYYELIECNCENVDGNKFTSVCGNYKFASGKYQTNEKSHSGKNSVITNKENPYALEIKLKKVKFGDYYIFSVWYFSDNEDVSLSVTTDDASYYSRASSNPILYEKNGWKLLKVEIVVNQKIHYHDLKVFVWNRSNAPAYFDDLQIIRYPSRTDLGIKDKYLEINIDSINYSKLLIKRNNALLEGIIIKDDSSWIDATMKYGKKEYKIDLRLKGDWTDHLYNEKWSFRIKIKKGKNWKGFRVFSIHSPEARNYIEEWNAHQFFEIEDVLTTRYGFVPIKINGKSFGVYAYEEHFEKQLIESKNRRDGPIIKYSEDLMWTVTKENMKNNNLYSSIPFFRTSQIVAFKISEILANGGLKKQFLIAQNLLFQHKNQMIKTSEIFDYDKLAKFYALADLFKLEHGCYTWHNLRFYYNPVLSKLEPIMFDGYADSKTIHWMILPFMGAYYPLYNEKDNKMQQILHPFSDKKFRDLYKKYLVKYSDSTYLDSVFNIINIDYRNNLSLIQKEYPYYKFNKDVIYSSAKNIRDSLKNFINYEDYFNTIYSAEYPYVKTSNDTLPENYGFIQYFVSAYIQKQNASEYEFAINNFYFKPIKIIGFGIRNNNITQKLASEKIINPASEKLWFSKLNIKSNDSLKYIFVKPMTKDTIIAIKISQWNMPYNYNPRQELENLCYNVNTDFFVVNNNVISLKNKSIKINKSVIIPCGYSFEITEGSVIDITNNAVFITYSPIKITGTKTNPVIIKSSDNSANGFTVLQANNKSYLKYVTFDGLSTLDYKGWTLTGAVNFYESDVEITNSSFINNVCEDGLNIIRSKFIVKDSKFENTFGDAFDSDFSKGKVINCTFNKLNNDAIDFSGSNVEITGCIISNAKDKGVSGGEKSKMKLNNLKISNCNIGIASKDKSKLTVENTSIANCNYGFVLLQKKPEYGDADINATNITLQNNKTEYLIEKGSDFSLNGKVIIGTEKKLAKQFYN